LNPSKKKGKTMSSASPALTPQIRNEAATAAEQRLRGKIADEELEKCVNSIRSSANKYAAGGAVICALFYWRITLDTQGKRYTGNAGGIGGLGGASTNGDIYTDDWNRLVREAHSFEFNSAFVYLNINIFNKDSQFLGHYQGGGVGTCGGIGGGTGSFS
jgi:hypothetical protein